MSDTRTSSTAGPIALLAGGVVIMTLALTWTSLSMRSVMYVGGSCADGGPYVSAQPCPEGSGFIGIAIPVMLLATFGASVAAARLAAPNLLVPMWTLLFGSLGWNFLEFAFTWPGGTDPGWLVCGIVFELMALPGLLLILFTRGTMWTSKHRRTQAERHHVKHVVGDLPGARSRWVGPGRMVLLRLALTSR